MRQKATEVAYSRRNEYVYAARSPRRRCGTFLTRSRPRSGAHKPFRTREAGATQFGVLVTWSAT